MNTWIETLKTLLLILGAIALILGGVWYLQDHGGRMPNWGAFGSQEGD